MFDPNKDGVDHINIYSKGKTELGRWMSNFTREPIELEDHGHFDSIEGYWYWLGTQDTRLRTLSGFAAKQLGRQLTGVSKLQPKEFQRFIKKALWAKVNKRPDMLEKLRATNLPLTHYYVFGTPPVVKMAGSEWITKFWEDLRSLSMSQIRMVSHLTSQDNTERLPN